MPTMKAMRFQQYGPPSVLSLQELHVPDLQPGEALVELHASAIIPSNVKNLARGRLPQEFSVLLNTTPRTTGQAARSFDGSGRHGPSPP